MKKAIFASNHSDTNFNRLSYSFAKHQAAEINTKQSYERIPKESILFMINALIHISQLMKVIIIIKLDNKLLNAYTTSDLLMLIIHMTHINYSLIYKD